MARNLAKVNSEEEEEEDEEEEKAPKRPEIGQIFKLTRLKEQPADLCAILS